MEGWGGDERREGESGGLVQRVCMRQTDRMEGVAMGSLCVTAVDVC